MDKLSYIEFTNEAKRLGFKHCKGFEAIKIYGEHFTNVPLLDEERPKGRGKFSSYLMLKLLVLLMLT